MLKTLLFRVIPLLFLSQLVTAQNSANKLVGRYLWFGFFELGASLELREDGSFSYQIQRGLREFESEGEWKVVNKKLFITSTYQPSDTVVKYYVEQATIPDTNNTIIVLDNESGDPVDITFISFYKGQNLLLSVMDTNANFKTNNNDYDFITVYSPHYYPILYKREDKSNYFKFRLVVNRSLYLFFFNKMFLIRRNKLVDPEIKKSKFIKSNIYYKEK